MAWKRVRFILLISLLALVALWLTSPTEYSEKSPQHNNQLLENFSWSTKSTTIWQIPSSTQADSVIITATQVNYKNEGKLSEFIAPNATLFNDMQTTTVTSNKGYSSDDIEVTFIENVNLIQTRTAQDLEASTKNNNSMTHLKTDELTYNVEQQKAYTDSPVKIDSDNFVLSGKGLEADLKNGNLTLKSDVKSSYTP